MRVDEILQPDPEGWRLFTCAEDYKKTFRGGYAVSGKLTLFQHAVRRNNVNNTPSGNC